MSGKMQQFKIEFDDAFIFVFIASILVVSIIIHYLRFFALFNERTKYLKMEMGRAWDEEEYRYWKTKLKRHYVGHIPFLGKYFIKLIK